MARVGGGHPAVVVEEFGILHLGGKVENRLAAPRIEGGSRHDTTGQRCCDLLGYLGWSFPAEISPKMKRVHDHRHLRG